MKFGLAKRDDQVDTFKKGISTMFEDFFATPYGLFETDWSPSVDIDSDNKMVYIKAEVPGVDQKELSVTFENGLLTISGEKKDEKKTESKDKKSHITERFYGSFRRQIRLPDGLLADKAKADFNNGVLTIEIPKEKADDNKKIKINVK